MIMYFVALFAFGKTFYQENGTNSKIISLTEEEKNKLESASLINVITFGITLIPFIIASIRSGGPFILR